MLTAEGFARCMAVLSAGVGRPMPANQAEVWFEVLSDLTEQQLRFAVVAALRDHKFAGFPAVGLLRQLAGVSGGIVDADAQAILAWDRLLTAMRHLGAYRSVEWDDAAIPAAIGSVAESWVALCDVPSEELHQFVRPRFIAAYKAHRAAGCSGETVTAGLLARDAGRIGFEEPPALRVGCDVPAIEGFGRDGAKALPGPSQPRLTALSALAESFAVPADDERPVMPSVVVRTRPKRTDPLVVNPDRVELEAQRRALLAKYPQVESKGA